MPNDFTSCYFVLFQVRNLLNVTFVGNISLRWEYSYLLLIIGNLKPSVFFNYLLQIRHTLGLLREAFHGVCNFDFTVKQEKIISKKHTF